MSSSRSTARGRRAAWPPSTRRRGAQPLDERLGRRDADVGGEEGVLDRLPRVLVEAVTAQQRQQPLAEAALRAREPLAQADEPRRRALGLLERPGGASTTGSAVSTAGSGGASVATSPSVGGAAR